MLDYRYKNKRSVLVYGQFVGILAVFALLFVCFSPDAQARVKNKQASLILDADTGLIIHQKNANKRLHPASLTKIMTLVMVFDALDRGEIRLNTRIKISKHAASMIPSKLGLEVGETIRVRDAIYAITTKSANDIAVALAEKLGHSEPNFARMMTIKARELGMKRTRFRNASGLHDPKQVSTARDMARLGRILVTTYKKHYHYFSKKSFTYKGRVYRSHNKLMDTYAGMDGLKTGYINKSGFNLVSSAVRNDRRLVGVVFGGKTGRSRNAQMARLLDESFNKIGVVLIAKNNIPVPQRKPIVAAFDVADIMPKSMPYILKVRERNTLRWVMLDSIDDNSMFNRMIGQGDYDISVRNRIETGLIAISSHMGETIPYNVFGGDNNASSYKIAHNLDQPQMQKSDWSIQIGAFTKRYRANKAISQSIAKLPMSLRKHKNTIAPLETADGWIFRGRIHGYTKQSANKACDILGDCIAISPNSYQ